MTNVQAETAITVFRDNEGIAEDTPAVPVGTDYLHRREMAERAAAKRSSTLTGRAVHQELAQIYAARRQTMTRAEND